MAPNRMERPPAVHRLSIRTRQSYRLVISATDVDQPSAQFGRYSRGSVIRPARALAATVAGEARKTWLSLWPMRPGKLRFVALMHFMGEFIRPKVSTGPPRQAEQPAFSVI